jgi:hypothetical protein
MTEDEGREQPPPEGDQPQAPPPAQPPPYAPPAQGGYPPPGQPPPYAPPPPGYPPPAGYGPPYQQPSKPNNSLALAALILGIVGVTILPGLASIPAIVCGFMGKKQIDESDGAEGGSGMAIAGIVMGFIGLVLGVLLLLMFVFLIETSKELIREIPFEELLTPTPEVTF